tara:strand:- start:756 stop:992 length:237 start_codon:yes stop_codon:yes gene_type:complete
MKLDAKTFGHIKNMISNKDSINYLLSFCNGYGLDTSKYSSVVFISDDKIAVTYRNKTYYVSYNHSAIYGTTYFNTIKN